MALPGSYTTVQVRGTYLDLLGNPVSGTVTFTSVPNALQNSTTSVTLIPKPVACTLDSTGAFSVYLPATDDPNIAPSGFTYAVTESFVGVVGRSYSMSVPKASAGAGIDISSVTPVSAAGGTGYAVLNTSVFETSSHASSTYAVNGLPTNAGTRSKRFDPVRGVYNFKASNTTRLRTALASSKTGSLQTLAFIGDSKIAGLGSNSGGALNGTQSMPSRLRARLAALGYTVAGTGPVMANQQMTTRGDDSRWVLTGSWTKSASCFFAASGAANDQAVFTSDLAGTVVEIYTFGNSAQFTYSIDGAAAVTVTPSGSSVRTTTITGLSNTTHTVTIVASAANTYVIGANVRATSGLQVANLGSVGTTATVWNDGNTVHIGKTALALPGNVTFLGLGVNDARTGISTTTYKTNMQAIITAHLNGPRDVVLLVPTPPAVADQTANNYTWNNFVSAMYDLADSNDIPLIDLGYPFVTWEIANPLGLQLASDSLHESDAGYELDSQTLSKAFL